MKNYIVYINDHSGSMDHLAVAAMKDYNANIEAVKAAASAEMQDTVVSVIACGLHDPDFQLREKHGRAGLYPSVYREITVSNPHVLKPKTYWPTPGGTPLYDSIADAILLHEAMPDIHRQEVSVLVMITTDGQESHSRQYDQRSLAELVKKVSATGRWTFVARVPKMIGQGFLNQMVDLGIPLDNIQKWDTTAAGMAASTVATTQAMTGYFKARSAGKAGSSSFFSDASKVDITALKDVTSEISLYVVPTSDNGIEIRPFVLRHRMKHLKGSAFYQLTKTEPKVQHDKAILVRDRASGKFFGGDQARTMIGLPVGQNARLHPGDHKNFDIFVQSNSINRKLVGGTGLAYWDKVGTEFTEADLAYLGEKSPFYMAPVNPTQPKPAVVQLPQVVPTGRPTPNPIPVTPMFDYFETRDEARDHCASFGIVQSKIQKNPAAPKSRRWAVPTALKKQQPLKKAA